MGVINWLIKEKSKQNKQMTENNQLQHNNQIKSTFQQCK